KWNVRGGVNGGVGGNGATGCVTEGHGGRGGDGIGYCVWNSVDAEVSGSTAQNVRGGPGGNSSATGTGRASGEGGGEAVGISGVGIGGGATIFQSNLLAGVRAGNGGRGQSAGGTGGG